MKILVNHNEAICNDCGQGQCAEVDSDGRVICAFCFSHNLKDKHWQPFVPVWKQDARNPARELWSRHLRRASDLSVVR